jgi:hypothetical protein
MVVNCVADTMEVNGTVDREGDGIGENGELACEVNGVDMREVGN